MQSFCLNFPSSSARFCASSQSNLHAVDTLVGERDRMKSIYRGTKDSTVVLAFCVFKALKLWIHEIILYL